MRHKAVEDYGKEAVETINEELHSHGYCSADNCRGRGGKAELKYVLTVRQTRRDGAVGISTQGEITHTAEWIGGLAVGQTKSNEPVCKGTKNHCAFKLVAKGGGGGGERERLSIVWRNNCAEERRTVDDILHHYVHFKARCRASHLQQAESGLHCKNNEGAGQDPRGIVGVIIEDLFRRSSGSSCVRHALRCLVASPSAVSFALVFSAQPLFIIGDVCRRCLSEVSE